MTELLLDFYHKALVKKNEEQTQGSRPEECHKNNGYGDTNTDKKLTHKDKDYGNKERSSVGKHASETFKTTPNAQTVNSRTKP